jgi:hypothetical protein
LDFAVVIAVVAVRLVQVAVDQIVDVVAVRNGFMAAAGAVAVGFLMLAAVVAWGASRGVGPVHFEFVLLNTVFTHVMQVAVVQIIDMVIVFDCGMSAILPVLVRVAFVMNRHLTIS